jgi:hypothetical protein
MTKTTFTNKRGQAETVTLPTRAFAEAHVARVGGRGATFEEVGGAGPAVKVVAAADADACRQATKAFYKAVSEGEKYVPPAELAKREAAEEFISVERRAEQAAEFFMDSRAAGMSQDAALADWDFVQSRGGR